MACETRCGSPKQPSPGFQMIYNFRGCIDSGTLRVCASRWYRLSRDVAVHPERNMHTKFVSVAENLGIALIGVRVVVVVDVDLCVTALVSMPIVTRHRLNAKQASPSLKSACIAVVFHRHILLATLLSPHRIHAFALYISVYIPHPDYHPLISCFLQCHAPKLVFVLRLRPLISCFLWNFLPPISCNYGS